jgi:hypothetical protein
VTGAEATSLFHLRCLWGDAYGITLADGVWGASRLHGAEVLTADSAEELTVLMQSDYSSWLATSRVAGTP